MKILGLTYYRSALHFTMKCDASLLNNRKPFFMPDWAEEWRGVPCMVVRISRLGKCIEPRFARRYYDAVAPGIDFYAADKIDTNYAQATAFDGSLCVGAWEEITDEAVVPEAEQIAEAIAQISRIVTLRMGDLVYIDRAVEGQTLMREQIIEQPGLYCKIK